MAGIGTTPAADTPRPAGIFAFGDLTDHLPEPSAERLRRLRQHVKDKRSVIPEFDQRRAASEDRITCAKRIEQLIGHRSMEATNFPKMILVSLPSERAMPSLMPSSSVWTN